MDKKISQPFFQLILIKKGEGIHLIGGKKFLVNDYQIHFVFPNVIHQLNFVGEHEIYHIQINENIIEKFSNYMMFPFSFYRENPVFNLNEDNFHRILYELINIEKTIKNNIDFWEIIYGRIRVITLMISKEACRLYMKKNNNTASSLMAKFITLMLTHYKQERSIKFYADKLFISPNYLNILCKKQFGKTATSIIINEILLEVKRTLMTSDKSIKELVYDYNFQSMSSFSSFFKKHTGLSPRDFVFLHQDIKLF
ncbi:AraC family transcriptional regulator [Chryseobacterium sp. CKR4-1]|uniref:AraC family transcriptional regulator n=1 Tax=Chryseobacterium sp. CKR4-1 TaxID=3068896 RepID=UPI002796AED2|nr:helix-turn-helix domain-containing protein [Chryseobacterium sp. CKR4-1]MDQ1805102.1 AraC family transcriptional regulator [Chryseobacterium sp. CKR4-1]